MNRHGGALVLQALEPEKLIGSLMSVVTEESVTSEPDSTMPDPEVVECVLARARRLKFPRPEAHHTVTVIYPIQLSPE